MKNILDVDEKYFGFLFHYYRAEVYRETNWRNRMDVSTNWAIVVTGVILSFAFGEGDAPHTVIILNYLIAQFFLYIEARRYRYYTMLRSRTRLMEEHLLAPILSGTEKQQTEDWAKQLAQTLARPKVSMSKIESFAWRLRRQYMVLLGIIFIAWVARIFMHPTPVTTLEAAIAQANVWVIPGVIVFGIFVGSLLWCMALAYIYVPRVAALVDDLP
ncbi:MAG: DUF2270 domain-containing protein [Patescibacteria group bacterium]